MGSETYDKRRNRLPANIRKHVILNNSAKEWVRCVHAGTIDGCWGLLRRWIIGSFHQPLEGETDNGPGVELDGEPF